MAQQTKNHRKFVATSVTAALVAAAVAPMASAASFSDVKEGSFYAEYVNQLADAGVIEGRPDGSFGLGDSINRAEAAKMISIIRGLDVDKAPAANFSDVSQSAWYAKYVNALYDAKLIDGVGNGKFDPKGTLTRAQFAEMVVKAYGLESKAATLPFNDVKTGVWYTESVTTLYANKLINGMTATKFGPGEKIKRADFAKLLVDTDLEFGFTLGQANVTAVSATNPTTLTLTGTGLKNLKAEDVTVEGNTVASVTSTDGKTAAVTLKTGLVPDREYKVSVKTKEGQKDFTVKFTFEVKDVKVTTTTLDDDADAQQIEFTVNGQVIDEDYLENVAGFTVSYETSLAGSVNTTTGEVDESVIVVNDEFNVRVVLTKAGVSYQSPLQTVKVVNANATPAIGSVVLQNLAAGNGALNSKTIVMGETYQIAGIRSQTGDVIDLSAGGAAVTYESSDLTAATVSSTGVVTPVTPGKTAKITIKAGTASYSVDLTTSGTARKISSITADSTSVTVAPTGTKTIPVTVKDQYGDFVPVTTGNVVESSNNSAVVGTVTAGSSVGKGLLTVDTTAAVASATPYKVYLKTSTGTLINTINVTVSTENTADVTKSKLELDLATSLSQDLTLDLNAVGTDDALVLNVNEYTAGNGALGKATVAAPYTIEVADTTIANAVISGTDITVTPAGTKTGSTQIHLKAGGTTVHTITVTVKKEDPSVSAFTWKAASEVTASNATGLSVTRMLDIVSVTGDDILKGVTLAKATTSHVRIAEADLATNSLTVYLDMDDDGVYDAGEELGEITAQVAPNGTGSLSTAGAVAALNNLTGTGAVLTGTKGSVIATFTKADGTVLTSTTLSVNVK